MGGGVQENAIIVLILRCLSGFTNLNVYLQLHSNKIQEREKWGSPSGDFPYSPSPKQLRSASGDRDAGGAKNPCAILSGLYLPLKFSVCFPKVLRVHSNLLGHWMQDVRSAWRLCRKCVLKLQWMKSSVTQASSAWDCGKEQSLGKRHYQQSSAASWHATGPPSPPTV